MIKELIGRTLPIKLSTPKSLIGVIWSVYQHFYNHLCQYLQ
ncbi:hypothetical protein [Candidatus Lokiarchaeum ossiferum]